MTTPAAPTKGLEGVVAATTRLSDVKGDIGELIYAGYDIHELAGKVSYEEAVHLLHFNHLPNAQQLKEKSKVKRVTKLKRYKVIEGRSCNFTLYFLAFARWCFVFPDVICCEPGKQ